MTILQYAVSDLAGRVLGFAEEEGIPILPEGQIAHVMVQRVTGFPEASTPSSVFYVENGVLRRVETAPLFELKVRAIAQIDAAGEALRMAVINNMPTQTEEYRQTLQQARDWRAAGYPETEDSPAPPDVTSWAMARWRDGWTNRQACDDILATAGHWGAVISQIRMLRLANKEDVRHAGIADEIAGIVADMRADMQAMAQQLNLTLTE